MSKVSEAGEHTLCYAFAGPASQAWEWHVKRPPSGVCGEQQESSWKLLSTCEGVRRRGCQQLAQTLLLI